MMIFQRYDVVARKCVGRLRKHVVCQACFSLAEALQAMLERQQEAWDSVALVPQQPAYDIKVGVIEAGHITTTTDERNSDGRKQ